MSTISKFLPVPPDNFSTQIASTTVSTNQLSIELDSASGLPTEGVGVFFKKDADGEIVVGSIEFLHWTGVAGNTITLSDTDDRGITGSDAGAQAYVADDYFEVWVSSYYQPTNGILEEHNADGTHGDVTATSATVSGVSIFNGEATFNDKRTGTVHDNGNSSTADTIDLTNGETQKSTLTGTCTYTLTNFEAGSYLTLFIIVDGTGGYSAPTITASGVTFYHDDNDITLTANAINAVAIRFISATQAVISSASGLTSTTTL